MPKHGCRYAVISQIPKKCFGAGKFTVRLGGYKSERVLVFVRKVQCSHILQRYGCKYFHARVNNIGKVVRQLNVADKFAECRVERFPRGRAVRIMYSLIFQEQYLGSYTKSLKFTLRNRDFFITVFSSVQQSDTLHAFSDYSCKESRVPS